MRPHAASNVTLRTSDGRSTARQRAIRLPKACPTKCAGTGVLMPGGMKGFELAAETQRT
jgi:hypothetical protein